jgi:glycosyltransferase involved in cell wall biosynthesis
MQLTDFVYDKLLMRSCRRRKCPPELFKPCWLRLPRETGKPGISVHGHILSEIGLGRAVRLMIAALESQSVPMSLTEIPLPGRQNERILEQRIGQPGAYRGSLTVGGLASFKSMSWTPCRRQFNIAYPFWELMQAPEKWREALDRYDAFWAPSTFMHDMLSSYQGKPVHLIRQPLELPAEPPVQREPDGMFRCLTYLDFDSVAERKNPIGTVRAFKKAFKKNNRDVELVIKVRGSNDRGIRQALFHEAANDNRIRIIDGTASREEIWNLLESSDVFISLHRSEGFGFGCAEALAAGKAVVATDYSGTTDFITPDTGYPVSWRPVPIPPEQYFGTIGASWAEPDVDDAATRLSEIASDPVEARRRALAGFRVLRNQHSIEAVGNRAYASLTGFGIL